MDLIPISNYPSWLIKWALLIIKSRCDDIESRGREMNIELKTRSLPSANLVTRLTDQGASGQGYPLVALHYNNTSMLLCNTSCKFEKEVVWLSNAVIRIIIETHLFVLFSCISQFGDRCSRNDQEMSRGLRVDVLKGNTLHSRQQKGRFIYNNLCWKIT